MGRGDRGVGKPRYEELNDFYSGGGGGVRHNTAVLYPIYYADHDMFRPLWAICRSQKCI